jgi:hypothetical protein
LGGAHQIDLDSFTPCFEYDIGSELSTTEGNLIEDNTAWSLVGQRFDMRTCCGSIEPGSLTL